MNVATSNSILLTFDLSWGIRTNIGKTEGIFLNLQCDCHRVASLFIKLINHRTHFSTNIERVIYFLFFRVGDNLEWKNHVQKIANKCSKTTGILNKLKHILPASISLMLYNSLLLPQLNYCILAWGHNCKRLIKLQKKALRIISISKYNAHTDPLFKKYRILKLPHILQLQELKCYHKYINDKLPAYLQSIPLKQNKSLHEHLTRSHLKLHITRTNHRFAERCIRNSIPLLVNTTPMEIINKIPRIVYTMLEDVLKNTI